MQSSKKKKRKKEKETTSYIDDSGIEKGIPTERKIREYREASRTLNLTDNIAVIVIAIAYFFPTADVHTNAFSL